MKLNLQTTAFIFPGQGSQTIGMGKDLAAQYPDAVIPGYTHMRRAQAVLWPHYLLAYFEMFARDWERFGEARRRGDNDAEAGQCIKQQQRRSRQPGTGPRQHLQMAGPGGEHQQ